ncbi:amidase [Paracoccus ravus]|uniref:amidase n=1 Tax=Paracoccus ravus TaxID=2447760 RepID=UPI00106E050D|nr:amidase [Paracoccus ravus]
MVELWRLAACDLIDGYRAAAFTPTDVLKSVLNRCDAINPVINAVIARDDAASLAMAQASAARWQAGQPLSPLDGVPISIKDNLVMAGLPATWGSLALARNMPEQDELPVARLREGGAVLFAKTNVPELTMQGYTDNLLFGPTGLPDAPGLTPGGSSGGAAAAVAAGIGPLALGTDGGGSIRRPAAHGGLFGLKPGGGRIARGRGFPAILGNFEVVGPIARDIRDIALAFGWLREKACPSPPAPQRILYARRFGGQPVDRGILALCDHAAERLIAAGHDVTCRDDFKAVARLDQIWPVVTCSGAAWMFRHDPAIATHATPAISRMAETGRGYSATDYAAAMVELEEMRLDYHLSMQDHDLLMTPAIAAFSWEKDVSHPKQIDGREVGPRGHAVFTAFANALGLPAISVPVGRAADGRACGIQLVGRPDDDELLIAIAMQKSLVSP